MQLIGSRLNIYSDDESSITNQVDQDCLYAFADDVFVNVVSTIPFCIRSNILEQVENDTGRCHGETLTFQTLKSLTITITDLPALERGDFYC